MTHTLVSVLSRSHQPCQTLEIHFTLEICVLCSKTTLFEEEEETGEELLNIAMQNRYVSSLYTFLA